MGNNLTAQTKTKLIARYAVIISGMYLIMGSKVFAAALFNHIVQPYVATALAYDSNVLRLPDNFIPGPDTSGNKTVRDSFIKQIKAGLAAKWQISQQQIQADVSVDQNWYSTYNELNYTGYNILGRWNWRIGQKFKGEISYNRRLALSNFRQINRLIPNLENEQHYVANGAYEIIQDWFLHAGFVRDSTHFPALERQQSNLREVSKEFGLRYTNQIENMLDFRVTITDGKYTSRGDLTELAILLDNAYTRTNYDLNGVWNYSVKTRFRGQIGYVSQEFKHLKNRNFSDITASGDILWLATAKSSLLLEAWREIAIADSLTASFSLNQGIRLTPTWTWSETPKIQLELPMSYEQQTSLGLNSDPTTSIQQKADQSIIRLNLNYTPIPNFEMTAFTAYENRHSNNPLHSYQDQMTGLNMKISF